MFFTSKMKIRMPGFTLINPSLLLVSIMITQNLNYYSRRSQLPIPLISFRLLDLQTKTRKHSRMRTICLPTTRVLVATTRCQYHGTRNTQLLPVDIPILSTKSNDAYRPHQWPSRGGGGGGGGVSPRFTPPCPHIPLPKCMLGYTLLSPHGQND